MKKWMEIATNFPRIFSYPSKFHITCKQTCCQYLFGTGSELSQGLTAIATEIHSEQKKYICVCVHIYRWREFRSCNWILLNRNIILMMFHEMVVYLVGCMSWPAGRQFINMNKYLYIVNVFYIGEHLNCVKIIWAYSMN